MYKVNKSRSDSLLSNFSSEQAKQYWQQFPDPTVQQIIKAMESVEHWITGHSPETEQGLSQLGKSIESFKTAPILEFNYQEEIITILANIKTGRCIYLLHELEQCYPGITAKLISYAQEHCEYVGDPMSVFLRRNIVFERLRIINRILSPKRIELIINALE